jgi:hypothetical protein
MLGSVYASKTYGRIGGGGGGGSSSSSSSNLVFAKWDIQCP